MAKICTDKPSRADRLTYGVYSFATVTSCRNPA